MGSFMPILTETRQAVWQAIETWPALADRFKRKYRFEDAPGLLAGQPTPAAGDLPAIAIYPETAETKWVLSQSQDIRYPLRVDLWTREWDVRLGEEIWEEIIRAMYQNLPISSGSARRVVGFSPLSAKNVSLGAKTGPSATRWSFHIEINAGFWSPKLPTP